MGDFLHECNTGDLKVDAKTFVETWCIRCHQPGCDLAKLAKTDPMAERNRTWRERFFGMPQADLSIPKYAQISQRAFPNLLQKAMRLEISSRRGAQDWSIPEIPVLDGHVVPASSTTTTHVDAAVRQLSRRSEPKVEVEVVEEPEEELALEEPLIQIEESRAPGATISPPKPRAPVVPIVRPTQRNTPDPGEVLIGGGPPPVANKPAPVPANPWAPPPKPTITIVKAGAKIQFGPDGKGNVVDG